MGGANVTNVVVGCVNNNTTLTASVSNLVLSRTGLTEYGITGTPGSGVPRVITITNTGSGNANGLTISQPTWPSGTSASFPSCGSTLAAGGSCTITVTPGNTATSNGTNPCSNGTAPVAGIIQVSATNANAVSINVTVLSYGCIYQGGYVFAFDDSTSTAGCVGGKVVTTSDLASASPNGIVWSSNGLTGHANPGTGTNPTDVSYDTLPGISELSTPISSDPTYATFDSFFNSIYSTGLTPNNPFTSASFLACKGNSDGQCNTANILLYYNRFITHRASTGTGPYTPSTGPTPLTYYAAGRCAQTIATYSDWYLPAICEMGFDRTTTGTSCGTQTSPTLQNIQLMHLMVIIGVLPRHHLIQVSVRLSRAFLLMLTAASPSQRSILVLLYVVLEALPVKQCIRRVDGTNS